MISARTKAALAAAKAAGSKLGGYRKGVHVDETLGRAACSAKADDYARRVGPIAVAAAEDVLSALVPVMDLVTAGWLT